MQDVTNWSFFDKISLTLLGDLWKNCSVLELLQISTQNATWKLIINDSDKFIRNKQTKKNSFHTIRCTIQKPVNQSSLLANWPVSTWKRVSTKRYLWVDSSAIKFLDTWEFVIKIKYNSYKETSKKKPAGRRNEPVHSHRKPNDLFLYKSSQIKLKSCYKTHMGISHMRL